MQELPIHNTFVSYGNQKVPNVTVLLHKWQAGHNPALEKIIESTYARLTKMAHKLLYRERHSTLQTCGLVHEVFLRLQDLHSIEWRDANHFFSVCCGMMRRIIIDHTRSANAFKRGGNIVKVTLDENISSHVKSVGYYNIDLLDLDYALEKLGEINPLQEKIVEYRYFAGLTLDEIATALNISTATVKRKWCVAQTWLFRELSIHD